MGMIMTMAFYGVKNAPMYGVHTNEKIEKFVNMYISCKPITKCTTSTHTYM
jgi:hypothetical protein